MMPNAEDNPPSSGGAPVSAGATADSPPFFHEPVLAEEVASLVPAASRFIADGTVGGGGHAEFLLKRFPGASLFGCDRDPEAADAAHERLAPFGERVLIKHLSFTELHHYVLLGTVDFLLLDIGLSSHQLDSAGRGFSFTRDGPLDMRMDPGSGGFTAADLVNGSSEDELRDLFFRLGEERFATRIAKAIGQSREGKTIATTGELAALVSGAVPNKYHRKGHHPATKVFQALRIAVNGELAQLEAVLDRAHDLLAPGGRVAVIAFHSLEDRMVKERFRDWENPCRCPPELPRCVCGKVARGRRITRKPLTPRPAEMARNPRSRSARLRAYEKNPDGDGEAAR